jgi:DNA modification methylase
VHCTEEFKMPKKSENIIRKIKKNIGNFQLDNYYVCDVLEGLQSLPDNSVHCVVTSPCYNLSGIRRDHGYGGGAAKKSANSWNHRIPYDNFTDDIPEDQYQQWMIDILNEVQRILVPGGSCFFNHKNRHCGYRDFLPSDFIQQSNINLFQELIWDRSTSVNCSKNFFIPSFEKIYWLTKTRDNPKFNRDNMPKEYCTAIWKIPIPRNPDHPASYPIQIPLNCILATTDPGDIIVDPFAGSGTTLLASKQLGRHYLGFDISKKYQEMFYNKV